MLNGMGVAYYGIVNEMVTPEPSAAIESPALHINLLGAMRIERGGVRIHLPRRKVESLLAYLLLHPGQHARDQLATLLWGDSTDTQARHSLRTALATLRQSISPDLLYTDRDHVQLNPDFPLWVDLDELLALEQDIEQAGEQIGGDALRAQLELWQGELLLGQYDDWITVEREHYRERLLALFLQLVQTLRARSEYAQAIQVAQRVLLHDPANETAHQHLMFCYMAAGDRAAALRQYERCVRALEEDLDAPPMPETTALYEWIRQLDRSEASAAGKITNLPIPFTSFVGRTRESAELKQLLAPMHFGAAQSTQVNGGVRLLTLTGTGGSGKTRLAIQTATDLIDRFAHGVWWVEFAALTDEELVARAVAKALGVQERADQTLYEAIANHIGDKALLLVIDNCEHVIDASAQLAAALLARCPNLQMLATSRIPLNITGEVRWQVPAFATPEPARLTMVDLLLQFESLRLFVERASAVQPGFVLTPENAQAAVEICYRLDGIPLAIELAAARVKVLTVNQIAERLSGALGARFALLTQGSRTVLPRHQTLRATIDWSHALLDDDERQLFRQAALFRGGFTFDMLEVLVATEANTHQLDLLDRLAGLVDHSLVMVEQQGGDYRYSMLESLREYALEQFTPAELAHWQQRHAAVFLQLALEAAPELVRADQQRWLDRLDLEHANLRTALEYLLVHNDNEAALRLAAALQRFWEARGHVSEGRNWLAQALAKRANTPLIVQAQALNGAGRLAFRQGDLHEAQRVHEEALLLFEHEEEEIGIADSLCYLANLDMDHGEYPTAQRRLEQAQGIYRRLNHELGLANSLSRLGNLAWDQDRYDDAAEFHRESLQIYQRVNLPISIAFQSLGVGDSERMTGNYESSRTYYEASLQIARSLRHRGLVAATLKSLGLLAARQQQYDDARRYGLESLEIFRELGDKIHTAFALSHLGDVAHHVGEDQQALAYYLEYLQIMHTVGYKWPTFYALEDIVELLTAVDQHAEVSVLLLGAADALRESTGLAVAHNFLDKYNNMSAKLRQQLGDIHFMDLWRAGQTTPLDEIVREACQLTLQ